MTDENLIARSHDVPPICCRPQVKSTNTFEPPTAKPMERRVRHRLTIEPGDGRFRLTSRH
jgi:hypothetical protein